MSIIHILLHAGHPPQRLDLRRLIEAQPDKTVVSEAQESPSALDLIREMNPAVIIMDMSSADASAMHAIQQLRRDCPEAHILILGDSADPAVVCAAQAAGGLGYLTKHASVSDLLAAIYTIAQGRPFVDPAVVGLVLQHPLMPQRVERPENLPPTAHALLSVREREVVRDVMQGLTNREIATRLGISEKTVKTHLRSVFRKLHIRRRIDLLRTPPTS